MNCVFILFVSLFIQSISGKNIIYSTSLVTCNEDSQISASLFNVTYLPDSRSLYYDLDISTQLSGNVVAEVEIYAYGFLMTVKQIALCDFHLKQFCPIYPGNIRIRSVQEFPEEYDSAIPSVAYQVPDIDAYMIVKFYDDETDLTKKDKTELACLQAFFDNGKTVAHSSIQWITAVCTGFGIIVSIFFTIYNNSIVSERISNVALYLLSYSQSVVLISMIHVRRVPPVAQAWVKNITWSMGLINVPFLQHIFRWYVESTGGTPPLHITSTTTSILTQKRSIVFDSNLIKRASNLLYGNQNILIFKGIERVAFNVGIENTSIVCTILTIFMVFGAFISIFVALILVLMHYLKSRSKINPNKLKLFANKKLVFKTVLLKYFHISFLQLVLFSLWEFTKQDSPAIIFLSTIFLICSIGVLLWVGTRTIMVANRSKKIYSNANLLLYGDENIFRRYGYFYSMFKFQTFWWNYLLVFDMLLKAVLIGLVQASGKTEALTIFFLEVIYLFLLIKFKPYLDIFTNVLTMAMSGMRVINSFFFLFFSDLFLQSYSVCAVIGMIFFIVNALFSVILFITIIIYICMCLRGCQLKKKEMDIDTTKIIVNGNKEQNNIEKIKQEENDFAIFTETYMSPLYLSRQQLNTLELSNEINDSDNFSNNLEVGIDNRESLSVNIPDASLSYDFEECYNQNFYDYM